MSNSNLLVSEPDEAVDMNVDVDVVVAGAGPVGLTLAAILSRSGVSVRVYEKQAQQRSASMGHNLIARTQELLDGVGLREPIARCSHPAPVTQMVMNGHPLARMDSTDADTRFGPVLFTHQGTVMDRLAEQLDPAFAQVVRGHSVLGADQDNGGVSVLVRPSDAGNDTDDGQPIRVRCRFLVGADGSRSAVRSLIGQDFEAQDLTDRSIRQMDATLSWRRSTDLDRLWFFLYPDGFAGIMPVWHGKYRVFFMEPSDIVGDRHPTVEEMTQRAREVTGDDSVQLRDPVWASHGTFRHGVSASFRQGRILLAGDAGHQTLPIGGQGMNTGIHDAVALAWRLSMTLQVGAGEDVLASYDQERQGYHAELGDQQVKGFKQLMYRPAVADKAIELAADHLPNLVSRAFGGDDLTQLDVAYRNSTLSVDALVHRAPGILGRLAVPRGGVRAGDRVPDSRVTAAAGRHLVGLHDVLRPVGRPWAWTLLLADGGDLDALPGLARNAELAGHEWVQIRWLLASAVTPAPADLPVFHDLDREAHAALGLGSTPTVLLVRPDGYVGYRGAVDDIDSLRGYLDRLAGAR